MLVDIIRENFTKILQTEKFVKISNSPCSSIMTIYVFQENIMLLQLFVFIMLLH